MNKKIIITILIGMFIIINSGFIYYLPDTNPDGPIVLQLSNNKNNHANVVVYSHDGKLIAIGSSLGISFYDAKTFKLIKFLPTDTWIRTIAFSSDDLLLVTGSYDSIIRIWQVQNGILINQLNSQKGWTRSLSLSPDNQYLATASDDNRIYIWNLISGQIKNIINYDVEGIRAIAFSPDGLTIASGGVDGVVRLWNVENGNLLQELHGHTDWIRALTFSPDGDFLASGGFDKTVRLWNVKEGKLIATEKMHSASVLSLSFSPKGDLLASASVDTTIRLWKVPNLEPYDLLKGHTDFVFSVVFAPDGKKLASASADNSVRIWDVSELPSTRVNEIIYTPSNCTACHHPQGSMKPARVLETTCSTCHDHGSLVFNWCPIFPRSPGKTTFQLNSYFDGTHIGVPLGNQEFGVLITSLGNGEVIYGKDNFQIPLKISGKIETNNKNFYSEINLRIEIWKNNQLVASAVKSPQSNGQFDFYLQVNPNGNLPFSNKYGTIAGEAQCFTCHQSSIDAKLPVGEVLIRVIATMPGKFIASDQRWIKIDTSDNYPIIVRVLSEKGELLSDIPVIAGTRLYDWRQRYYNDVTDINGEAHLEVEALSQNPTTYTIEVPSGQVHDQWIEGLKKTTLTLEPGGNGVSFVEIPVRSSLGAIKGKVNGITKTISIFAIHLPEGIFQQTETSSNGEFNFSDLSIGKYRISPDLQGLQEQHLQSYPQDVNFESSPNINVDVLASPTTTEKSLQGLFLDSHENWLPFGWVSSNTISESIDPFTGTFTLRIVSNEKNIIATVPGYYSKEYPIQTIMSNSKLIFTPLPGTKILSWGNGSLIIPSIDNIQIQGREYSISKGWLWGNGESASPLTLICRDKIIVIYKAQFALDCSSYDSLWFYLINGNATLTDIKSDNLINIHSGEMLYLGNSEKITPVSYNSSVYHALHWGEKKPIMDTWESGIINKIKMLIIDVGIGSAQFITFIGYIVVIITFIIIVAGLVVKWIIQKRKKD